jgi:hypothetical protein
MRWRQYALILLVLFSLSLSYEPKPSEITLPQATHCDPALRGPNNDPYGYRPRGIQGDRCEGIYIREVASTPLLVASLTEWFEDFDPAAGGDLLMEWTAPGNAGIHLRAYTLKHRLYYRMDSLRPAGSNSYIWQPSLLSTLKLTKKDLGIVAWTSHPVGKQQRDVYLPLQIKQRAKVSKSQGYQLVLLPGVELSEVFLSLAPVKSDGEPGTFIKNAQKLGYGYYPAERGIPISITELKTPGIYHLKIGAELRAGGSSTTQIWFNHRGK